MGDDEGRRTESPPEQEPSSPTDDRPQIPQISRPELDNYQTEGIDRAPEIKKIEE
jgi:hypothetical protein